MELIWIAAGFLSGSLPFSVWLGRAAAHADVRAIGDGNPGAANAWKAGGWRLGVAVLALDYLKGAIPVGLAHFVDGVQGWALVPVALAPALGHAFSPFLRFRGGKGLTVTFGLWTGVTLWEAPVALGLLMTLTFLLLGADAWAAVLAMAGLLGYLLLRAGGPELLAIGLGNMALLLWTHRAALRRPVRPDARLFKLLRRRA